jgi:hypothetical protein
MLLGGGCAAVSTNLHVESRPEGLAVDLQGYRFLLRDVHELNLSVRNAGEGVLYRLNGHEVLIVTNREIRVDGQALDLGPGQVHEILSPRASPPGEPPPE